MGGVWGRTFCAVATLLAAIAVTFVDRVSGAVGGLPASYGAVLRGEGGSSLVDRDYASATLSVADVARTAPALGPPGVIGDVVTDPSGLRDSGPLVCGTRSTGVPAAGSGTEVEIGNSLVTSRVTGWAGSAAADYLGEVSRLIDSCPVPFTRSLSTGPATYAIEVESVPAPKGTDEALVWRERCRSGCTLDQWRVFLRSGAFVYDVHVIAPASTMDDGELDALLQLAGAKVASVDASFAIPGTVTQCDSVKRGSKEYAVFKRDVLCRYARATSRRMLEREQPYIWEFESKREGRRWGCEIRGRGAAETGLCVKRVEDRLVAYVPIERAASVSARADTSSNTPPASATPSTTATGQGAGHTYQGNGKITTVGFIDGKQSWSVSVAVRYTLGIDPDGTASLIYRVEGGGGGATLNFNCEEGTFKVLRGHVAGGSNSVKGTWTGDRFKVAESGNTNGGARYSQAASGTFDDEHAEGKWRSSTEHTCMRMTSSGSFDLPVLG